MPHETIADAREDTMIYRVPTEESDESAVQEIWGEKLEVRTVDASEVPALLSEGWAAHPAEIGKPHKKPENKGGHEVEALYADRSLLQDTVTNLEKALATAIAERDQALADLKASEALLAEEAKVKTKGK